MTMSIELNFMPRRSVDSVLLQQTRRLEGSPESLGKFRFERSRKKTSLWEQRKETLIKHFVFEFHFLPSSVLPCVKNHFLKFIIFIIIFFWFCIIPHLSSETKLKMSGEKILGNVSKKSHSKGCNDAFKIPRRSLEDPIVIANQRSLEND